MSWFFRIFQDEVRSLIWMPPCSSLVQTFTSCGNFLVIASWPHQTQKNKQGYYSWCFHCFDTSFLHIKLWEGYRSWQSRKRTTHWLTCVGAIFLFFIKNMRHSLGLVPNFYTSKNPDHAAITICKMYI